MGPTASGKTDVAIHLLEHLPVEIISVDSVMIYRGMNIGSAKPEPEVLARAPHRLIDILDPSQAYSAARFRTDALQAMQEITEQGKIPLLVGGTMLYFRALIEGLAELPSADKATRERLEQQAREIGWEAMHVRLQGIDPQAAARIHPNDPQRIQRALEIHAVTGEAMSTLQARQTARQVQEYRFIKLILSPHDRSVLHERISRRFHSMLAAGFMDEVKGLYERGDLNPDMPSMRAVGYRQAWEYLAGQGEYEAMVERGIIATRQLARRQLTWLRAESHTNWVDSKQKDLNGQVLREALKQLETVHI